MKLYKGNLKPYLYALFAREDETAARGALDHLEQRGYNMYCGLPHAGADVEKAAALVLFLSSAVLRDADFLAALDCAVAKNKPIITTYLEDVALPPALEVPLGAVQGIFRARYENEQDYFDKLISAEPLQNVQITPAQKRAFRRVALGLTGGALAAVVIALAVFNPFAKKETAAIAAAPTPTPYVEADPVMEELFAGYTQEDLAKVKQIWLCGDVRVTDWSEIAQEDRDGERKWYYKGTLVERGTIRDLSILTQMPNLEEVELLNQSVTDISPIFETGVRVLDIEDCPVESIEGIERMKNLQVLELGMTQVSDIAPLSKLHNKKDVGLCFYCNPIRDYAPLASFTSFQRLHLNVSDLFGNNYADTREILHMLAGKTVVRLELFGPNDSVRMEDIANLQYIQEMDIANLRWSSLEGMEQFVYLKSLNIQDMDELHDLSGLEGMRLERLYLNGNRNLTDISALYTLPRLQWLFISYPQDAVTVDFSKLTGLAELSLTQVRSVRDLSALPLLKTKLMNLGLCMMPWLDDLSPVESTNVRTLRVSPNLEEAAYALQAQKTGLEVQIDYTNWTEEQVAEAMELHPANEEQLLALSDKDLAYVVSYGMVGERFYDPEAIGWLADEWDDEGRHYLLDGERVEGEGTVADLSHIERMTGLKRLELVRQPLSGVEGIQALSQLESVRFADCPVSDIAPLFAIPTLRNIDISDCPITSIQGVQNLFAPVSLNFNDAEISDISPLADCDFTEAYQEGGLQLGLSNNKIEDFSALEAIEAFQELSLGGMPAARWLPHIKAKRVEELRAGWTQLSDADIETIAKIEGLRELQIDGQEQLTDLTPLLSCETLEKVYVSAEMEKALDTVRDKAAFEIEVW